MSAGKILVLPGDHIGPEVVTEALAVLDIIEAHKGIEFEREFDLCGGCSLDKHGIASTKEVLQKSVEADAVFFGSAGGPEWGTKQPNPESGLLRVREKMQVCRLLCFVSDHCGRCMLTIVVLKIFANLRPCYFPSQSLVERAPIKAELVKGVNFMLIRENCGGAYFGKKIEEEDYGCDPWEYTRAEIERVARVAGALAMQTDPPTPVTSVDKANVLANSRVWRRIVTELFEKEYPKVKLQHQLADSLAMLFITQPTRWNGIILTDNTFGDILSDESGGLTGSIGLLPSASLAGPPGGSMGQNSVGGARGLYEPVHGSAPDISGKGLANPIAQVLSLAMMLRYSFNMHREADIIDKAVEKVLDAKNLGGLELRSGDLGGKVGTKEMSEAIQKEVKKLLEA
jgi:3-isopropylmalate dehydrogenase